MQIQILTAGQYARLAPTFGHVDFLQSPEQGNRLVDEGWNVEYLAGVKDDRTVAVAMIGYTRLMKFYKLAYCPRGFFIDYNDGALLKEWTQALLHHVKKNKAIYLEIDPTIVYKERDQNGDLVQGGIDNSAIDANLQNAGWQVLPRRQGYDMSRQCRWVSILDLRNKDKETIFKEFSNKTRNDIRNAQKYGVKTRVLEPEELSILDDMERESGSRHQFEAMPIDAYQSLYAFFGKEHIQTVYAYLDLEDYEKTVLREWQKTKAEMEDIEAFLQTHPDSAKKQKRLKVAKEYFDSLTSKKEELSAQKAQYGKELPLACSLFVKYDNQIVYLVGGSRYDMRKYRGPYAIQWKMISQAVEEGYDFYNFYGISGFFEKGQDGYGVFDFKRGFNARVVEYLGVYHLPVRKALYRLCQRLGK